MSQSQRSANVYVPACSHGPTPPLVRNLPALQTRVWPLTGCSAVLASASHANPPQASLLGLLGLVLAATGAAAQSSREADYVIVGGGTAGCALAARLCAGMPGKKVTLLERGRPRTAEQDLLVKSVRNAFYSWDDPGLVEAWDSNKVPGLNKRKVLLRTGAALSCCIASTTSCGAARHGADATALK